MDDPITISSSDSDIDFEFDTDDDDAFNTNVRDEGYREKSGNISSPQSAPGSIKRSSNPGCYLQTEDPRYLRSDADFRSSASQRSLSTPEYQKRPMEQLDKGAFPSPFLTSLLYTKPKNFGDGEHIHWVNVSGRFYPLAGPSVLNGKNHGKENISEGIDNDVIMLDKVGTRMLPPWTHTSPYPLAGPSFLNGKNHDKENISRDIDNDAFMLDKVGTRMLPPWTHALPVSSGHNASSVDPIDPFRTLDERIGGTDERSVFQEVMQDLNQPTQEVDIPDGLLSVPLLRHQKIALAWMRQKEARPFCVGGILADDQGLGKTISTIALVQMERYSEKKSKSEDKKIQNIEALDLDDDDDNGIANLDDFKPIEDSDVIKSSPKETSPQQASYKQRPAAGTLVVCPATVLRQWARELEDKVTLDAKLNVLVYHGSNRTKDPSLLAKYDVVLTTYAIVTNEVPKQPLADEDDTEQKTGEKYGLSAEISNFGKRKKPSSFNKKGKKGRKGIDSCLFDSDSGTLAKVRWLRVVLDEAQTIKNHRTQVARACCALRAKKRWCLSGTPIQNTIDELFSYFRFLKYDPYSSYKAFRDGIKNPISRDSKYGYQKLQIVLRTVLLRRTKGTLIDGQPIISLPPKFIKMRNVNFTLEEREFYVKLEADSRIQFKAYADAGTVNQNYANILLMLLRLRQACDHPHLVCGFGAGSVRKNCSIEILKQLPKDKLANLLSRLQCSPICQICADPPEDAVVAMCGHVFCDQCVSDHLAGDDNTCPATKCKEQLSTDVVFSEATLIAYLSDGSGSSVANDNQHRENSSILSKDYLSSKIRAALEILQLLSRASIPCIDLDVENSDPAVHVRTEVINPGPSQGRQKAIVFSQWTRMLDLLEAALLQSNIRYCRLDGTMSLAVRDKAVREFNTNPEVAVMLMSLKAGNLGLNMVAACHVILLDLWWNPTTEDQAVDRAHRIGQTRAVTVSRLTIKDTVEDRILALQEDKRKMVASAFGEDNGGVSTRLTAQDLRFLFMGA